MADFPVCVTCKRPYSYKGPKPNLLPCLHSVCDDCVTSATQRLKCSTCLRDFIKTDATRDIVRERKIFQLTVKHNPSELLCTNKDDGNQAISWCGDCRYLFCENCQISHDEVRLTRQHDMKRLEEMSSIENWGEDPLICQKHKDQTIELYDKTCRQPVCFRCLYEDHNTHETVGIKDHLLSAKEKLNEHLTSVQEQKQRVIELQKSSAEQVEKLNEREVLLRDSIRQTFDELRTLVEQRQKEVLLELDLSVSAVKDKQKTTNETLQVKSNKYQIQDEYLQATLQFMTSTDTVLKGEKMMESIAVMDRDLPSVERRDTLIVFNKAHVDDIKESLKCFGSVLSLRKNGHQDDEKVTVKIASETHQGNETLVLEGMLRETAMSRSSQTDSGTETDLWSQITSNATAVALDKDRVHKAHITDRNELKNITKQNHLVTSLSLKSYRGTISTNPLPDTGFTYWEVDADIGMKVMLKHGSLVLEAGISDFGTVNNNYFVRDSNHTNVMTVQGCGNHKMICTTIWKDRKLMTCAEGKTQNYAGSKLSLHIGILFNKYKNKVTYFDLKTSSVIQTVSLCDVDGSVWATFGVFNREACEVTLKMVSGSVVQFTEAKYDLIKMVL